MSTFQQVVLIGRLGREPSRRVSPTGDVVCSLSLATDEAQGVTEWHTVIARDAVAELAYHQLKVGMLVRVVGRLRTRELEKRGVRWTRTSIIASRVEPWTKENGAAGGSPQLPMVLATAPLPPTAASSK
jgi:single-strand DNA-binding protein